MSRLDRSPLCVETERPSLFVVCLCPAPDNNQLDLVRFRDSGLRSSAASAAVEEVEELLGMGTGGKDKSPGKEAAAEETVKIRNIDTGEDIALTEIDARVPPSLDPGELFRTKDVS